MEESEVLGLANVGQGAAIEKFDLELERCLKNILDPNTEDGPREIVLKVVLKPNEKRNLIEIGVHCKSNLKPVTAFTTAAAIGRRGAYVEAREIVQQQLPGMAAVNVTNIEERRQ